MNNKMNELSTLLTAAGVHVSKNVTGSDTVFANGFGIFCSLLGNVQARNVRDKDERFGIGTCEDSAETLCANFLNGYASLNYCL